MENLKENPEALVNKLNNISETTKEIIENTDNRDVDDMQRAAEEIKKNENSVTEIVHKLNKQQALIPKTEISEYEDAIGEVNDAINNADNEINNFYKQYERLMKRKGISDKTYTIRTRVFPAPFTNQKGTEIGRIEQVYEGELPYGATDYVDHFLVNLYRSIENETGQANDQKAFEYEEADPLIIRPLNKKDGGSRNAKKSASKKSRTHRKRRARK